MPFTASSYLPATTPKSRTFHHVTRAFDVVYHFNEYGYRGKHPQHLKKTPGTKRILVVGDSFTLGWGNDLGDTFVQQVSDDLETDGYEVINAGYRGYITPDAYYAYLQKEGMALQPDVVVIVLFSGNDITEIRDNEWLSLDERGMPLELRTTRLYTDYKGDFLFPPGSRDKLVRWNYRIPVLRESRTFIGVTQLIDKAFSHRPFYQPKYTLFGKLQEPQPINEGWRRFRLTVASLNRLGADRGVKVAFVMIAPSPFHWKEDSERTLSTMQDIVRKSGAPMLNLRSHVPSKGFLGMHYNKVGNEIVARKMVKFLRGTPSLLPAVGMD